MTSECPTQNGKNPSGCEICATFGSRFARRQSVAKCHTFSTFRNPHTLLAIQVTENKGTKKVSHLSHLSPLSHFRVVSLEFVGKGLVQLCIDLSF